MLVEEFVLKGNKDINLSCFKVIPIGEIKGIIQIFHGMGEHKNRYHNFAKYMAQHGFAVYAHDHRKHGYSTLNEESVGIFEKEDTWDLIIKDCNIVSVIIQQDLPNIPIIIMGHSMGSIIARKYISSYSLVPKMAIIMGTLPPISTTKAFAPILLTKVIGLFKKNNRLPFIKNLLNDPLTKNIPEKRTKFDWLTKDAIEVDKYLSDPLCGYAYSKYFYLEFFKAMVEINKKEIIMKTNDIPLLFISGEEDSVSRNGMDVIKVEKLYNQNGYKQSSIKLIKNNRHEVINEIGKIETFDYLVNWINKEL